MKSELFKKTDTVGSDTPAGKYDRLTVSLNDETSKILESLVRKVRDETGYKVKKTEIVIELIKLLPAFEINTFLMGSKEDVKTQFETIRKKIESGKFLIND